jgi:Flagellar hook-length control protein FliK
MTKLQGRTNATPLDLVAHWPKVGQKAMPKQREPQDIENFASLITQVKAGAVTEAAKEPVVAERDEPPEPREHTVQAAPGRRIQNARSSLDMIVRRLAKERQPSAPAPTIAIEETKPAHVDEPESKPPEIDEEVGPLDMEQPVSHREPEEQEQPRMVVPETQVQAMMPQQITLPQKAVTSIDPKGKEDEDVAAPPREPSMEKPVRRSAIMAAREVKTDQHGERELQPESARTFEQPAVITVTKVETSFSPAAQAPVAEQVFREVKQALPAQAPAPRAIESVVQRDVVKVLQFSLQPESLGPIKIALRLRGEELELKVEVTTHEAQAVLQRDREVLTDLLADAGYVAKDQAIVITLAKADPSPSDQFMRHQAGDSQHRSFQREPRDERSSPRQFGNTERGDAQTNADARASRANSVFL